MKARSGISLIEVCITLALISLATMLTLHVIPNMQHGFARSDMQALYQAIIYTQRHAILQRKKEIFTFYPEQGTYSFCDTLHTLSKEVHFGTLPDVLGPPASPHTPLTTACTFKDNQIIMHPDGTMSAGAIYITDTNQQRLYACTIAVAPYAYVRRYRWQKKWQKL